jgi:dTDP-glucose pyrophosphorylase
MSAQPPVGFRPEPLDPAQQVAADATIADAATRLLALRRPLLWVRTAAGPAALSERDLRRAVQDELGARAATTLARGDLVATDRAAATALLARAPDQPGALVAPDGAPVEQMLRAIRPLRVAVVMAGGEGRRLRPLTEDLPKPLVPVGGRPLLARTLEWLRESGVERVFLSIRHLGERIRAAVGDGSALRLAVEYLTEEQPLDTGAGLVRMPRIDEPFLLLNGDVLTNLDLQAFARHHALAGGIATVATYLYAASLPYGVVHRDSGWVLGIEEKPVLRYPINAGIYAFAPAVLARVPPDRPLPMVPFLNDLIARGERVARFPLIEYWNDVGSPKDYERAQQDVHEL